MASEFAPNVAFSHRGSIRAMPSRYRLHTALESAPFALGTWAQMNSPEFCEIASASGLDFVMIDMEHGSFSIDAAVNMIRATQIGGAAPIVRVPACERALILKVLDAGAAGVLVPGVESAEVTAAAVSAARYAPAGTRGACPCVRASSHGVVAWKEYLDWAERTVKVGVLVETPAGVDNFESIVRVPGLDFVTLGPFDLSQAMGYEGDWKHPAVTEVMARLITIARANGVEVMMTIFDSDAEALRRQRDRWVAIGARLFTVSGDRFMLSSGFNGLVAALK